MNSRWIAVVVLVSILFTLAFSLHLDQVQADSRTKTVSYQTTYRNQNYQKQALVYLPDGYNDQQKYNVIYLLHGSTESATDFYRDGNFKKVLDRLMASGKMKKSIVVFPTYYPSRSFVSPDYYRDDRLNRAFARHELVDDLVPAVEGRYHTYANGVSRSALQSSRTHRAFGGFSMGSITTWYVFNDQLPYFAEYLPMAGDSWLIGPDGGASASRQTARRLAQTVQKNSRLPFRIFAGVGNSDGTVASMEPQIRAMWQLPEFTRENLKYYEQPSGTHSPQTIARIVSHYAHQMFATSN